MTENTISQYIKNSPGATANVRDNFPIVLDFLQAYYAWMETSGEPISGIFSLLDNRDIDSTLNGFLSYFRYEFLPNIPATIIADPKKLLKHAKDFYLARGSEKSFALLFRILYNDSVLFYNVFDIHAATRILYFKLETELHSILKTFLCFLNSVAERRVVCHCIL